MRARATVRPSPKRSHALVRAFPTKVYAAAPALATGALATAATSCIAGGEFVCSDDTQCGAGGTCEPSGWCSFPDASCPSGARYSRWAGDDLADACTEPAPATTGADESSTDDGPSGPPADRDSDPPMCGNGIVEVHEDCDDMNLVDGDGCNACVASGTIAWQTRLENDGDDLGHGIAVAATGEIYVAAQHSGQNGNAWVQLLAADGTTGWSDFVFGSLPDAALGIAVATALPDGKEVIERALFVVGYQTPPDDPDEPPPPVLENQFVRRLDDDGSGPSQDWSSSYNSAEDGNDRALDVEIAPGLDRVVVVGYAREAGGVDADATIRAYPATSSNDAWFFATGIDANRDDFATAGAIDEDGRVWAVGERHDGDGDVDAWIAHIAVDEDLVPSRQWLAVVNAADSDDAFTDVALAPNDELVAVGHRGARAWIAGFAAQTRPGVDTEPRWQIEPPGLVEDAVLHGLAIDGAGALVVVGAVATADRGTDAWVQKLDPALEHSIWSSSIDGSAHGDDIARAVAIGPDDAVLVVGDRLELADDDDGVDRDVWIAAHMP
jgi:cysteine-rich repeat protein